MYEEIFGFTRRPFSAVPYADRYFPGQAIETARESLACCIERAAGCGLILGPVGTGKSLLCQVLVEQFRQQMVAVLLSNQCVESRKDLLQAILFELELPYQDRYEGELRLALIDFLSPGRAGQTGQPLLLIVDEAHTLPLVAFEELRLLTNLIRGGTSRVRLVLAGSLGLEERLADPNLASLNQRTVTRAYLRPFSLADTQSYIRAQTAAAGADPDAVWSGEALQAVHRITDGVPRLINQLCDHILLTAAAEGKTWLEEKLVEEAWANLQQLPLPLDQPAASPPPSDAASIVEFGSLDDDAGEAAAEVEVSHAGVPGEENLPPPEPSVEPLAPATVGPWPEGCGSGDELDVRIEQLDALEHELAAAILPTPVDQAARLPLEPPEDAADLLTSDAWPADEDDRSAEEIVLDTFVGMEADNIVRLAPSGHTCYVGPEEVDSPGRAAESVSTDGDAPPRAAGAADDSPPATWGTEGVQSREFVAMASGKSPWSADAAPGNPAGPAAAAQPLGPAEAVPTNLQNWSSPQPAIFVEPPHGPQTEIYLSPRRPGEESGEAAEAAGGTASADRQASGAPDPQTLEAVQQPADGVAGQHPLIPVRSGEYRQLFAKLRAQRSE
ncbi:MAG: AAA family ATPase [Planctomycetales bacterium]|nr:AAA family ATPase [Planctomycetales bacterium]